jgi:energy-coupling factor transporter ATP-binding protein EcfA2
MLTPLTPFTPVMVCSRSDTTDTMSIENRIANYKNQYDTMYSTVQTAITNGHNVVICGPGRSGKSYITDSLREVLQLNGYKTYYGVQDYAQYHRPSSVKFWIEELDTHSHMLSDIMHDYKYIELTLQHEQAWGDNY